MKSGKNVKMIPPTQKPVDAIYFRASVRWKTSPATRVGDYPSRKEAFEAIRQWQKKPEVGDGKIVLWSMKFEGMLNRERWGMVYCRECTVQEVKRIKI